MNSLHEINLGEFHDNLFEMIGKEWMLITTEYQGFVNSMTASCGMFGNVYPYGNVAMVYIRPQRYTFELINKSDTFSLSFFAPQYKNILEYFGTISGREEKKIEKSGLTITHLDDIPYFEEAKTVFLCKKVYAQQMTKESFVDLEIPKKLYPQEDYHIMFLGQIVYALK